MEYTHPTNAEIGKGRILADKGGKGALPKISERNIDILGYIQGHFSLLTDKYQKERVQDHIRLLLSISEIICKEAIAETAKKGENSANMEELAPKP